jgi:uncharacterized membrane protein YdjX (TVP38/TMEM64 family)
LTENGGVRTVLESPWLRAAVLVLLLTVGLVLVLTVDLPSVPAVRRWVDGAGGAGWAALVLGTTLILLAPVPRSAVTVLVGVVAGFWPGFLVASAAAFIAALAAFGLSRGLGRSAVTRLAGRRLARVDSLLGDRGFVPVLVARLLPIVPFAVCSYGAGLFGVRLGPYLLATALGLPPGTAVQVGIGASAALFVSGQAAFTAVPLAVGLVLLGWLAVRVWRGRREPAVEPAA